MRARNGKQTRTYTLITWCNAHDLSSHICIYSLLTFMINTQLICGVCDMRRLMTAGDLNSCFSAKIKMQCFETVFDEIHIVPIGSRTYETIERSLTSQSYSHSDRYRHCGYFTWAIQTLSKIDNFFLDLFWKIRRGQNGWKEQWPKYYG